MQVYMTAETQARLRALAETHGLPAAGTVRLALRVLEGAERRRVKRAARAERLELGWEKAEANDA